ncbi:MAG: hypothetical protein WD490_01020 [Opitutales bacterium]
MRLKNSDPEASEHSGFYVRPGPDEPERGPLILEKLQDLAEFGHITPDWLVRASGEESFFPFRDLPELMTAVFPEKKSFHLKRHQKAKDTEAGYAKIDVKDLYRCDADGEARDGADGGEEPEDSPQPAMPAEQENGPQTVGSAPIGIDVKALLQASVLMAKERSGKDVRREKVPFSTGRVFQTVRWSFAVFFGLLGIYILGSSGSMRLAIPMFAFSVLLVALDFVGWMCDGLEGWIVNAAGKPPDFSDAEGRLKVGDWAAAAAAFLAVTRKHPKEIHGYFAGLSAAFAARDKKTTAAFHSLAQKNLGTHDLNLLNGALRRRKVPPVPPSG